MKLGLPGLASPAQQTLAAAADPSDVALAMVSGRESLILLQEAQRVADAAETHGALPQQLPGVAPMPVSTPPIINDKC